VIIKMFFVFSMFLLLLTGCGEKEQKRVAVFYNDFEKDAYASVIRHGLDRQLSERNVRHENYNANSSQQTQTEQIEHEIRSGANVLVVNMAEDSTQKETEHIIDAAQNAQIPIVFFGSPVDEALLESYNKSVYIGADHEEAQKVQGRMIGQYLLSNYDMVDLNGDGVISYVMYPEKDTADIHDVTGSVDKIDGMLALEGKPAIEYFDNNEAPHFIGGDSHSSYTHLSEALKTHNDENANMIELVIAGNDMLALGAVDALHEAGYNNDTGTRIIPVFGIDATVGAQSAIYEGMMTGSVRQDSEYMTEVIERVCRNMLTEKDKFDGIDDEIVTGKNSINIPYEEYYGTNNM